MSKFEVDQYGKYDFTKSSMTENREFLYEATRILRPKRIVELGTYYGCSYWAFAQAIKDFNLATYLIGIDAWEGDQHTGFYDSYVYDDYREIFKSYFFELTRATHIKSTFSEAVSTFEDESIDLLLIDGTHTYEAAKEDFETWLPKLSANGIVLFHDTKVKHFSLKDYWTELSSRYVSYNFDNEFGLGVLAPKGDKQFLRIRRLFPSVLP